MCQNSDIGFLKYLTPPPRVKKLSTTLQDGGASLHAIFASQKPPTKQLSIQNPLQRTKIRAAMDPGCVRSFNPKTVLVKQSVELETFAFYTRLRLSVITKILIIVQYNVMIQYILCAGYNNIHALLRLLCATEKETYAPHTN